MPAFKTIDGAIEYIQNSIADALDNEVFEKVRETMLRHILTDVYGAYPKPKMYDRRKENGGFADPNNIKNIGSGMTLEVVNETPPNPEGEPEPTVDKNLAEVIESGSGYDYFSPGARPYNQNTIDDLLGSGEIVQALVQGLKRKGIKVV